MKKGFSLIEVMIVVGIIGILSMIAVPAYQEYVLKIRVVEALHLLTGYKSDMVEYMILNGGKCPSNRKDGTAGSGTDEENINYPAPTDLSTEYLHATILLKDTGDRCGIWAQFKDFGPNHKLSKQFIALRVPLDVMDQGSMAWLCVSGVDRSILPRGCLHGPGLSAQYTGRLR